MDPVKLPDKEMGFSLSSLSSEISDEVDSPDYRSINEFSRSSPRNALLFTNFAQIVDLFYVVLANFRVSRRAAGG